MYKVYEQQRVGATMPCKPLAMLPRSAWQRDRDDKSASDINPTECDGTQPKSDHLPMAESCLPRVVPPVGVLKPEVLLWMPPTGQLIGLD